MIVTKSLVLIYSFLSYSMTNKPWVSIVIWSDPGFHVGAILPRAGQQHHPISRCPFTRPQYNFTDIQGAGVLFRTDLEHIVEAFLHIHNTTANRSNGIWRLLRPAQAPPCSSPREQHRRRLVRSRSRSLPIQLPTTTT